MIQTEPLPWAESVLDRACGRRSAPGFLEELLGRREGKCMVLIGGRALVHQDSIVFLDPNELPAPELTVYLGRTTAAADDGAALPAAFPAELPAEHAGGDMPVNALVNAQSNVSAKVPPVGAPLRYGQLALGTDVLVVVLPDDASGEALTQAPEGSRLAGYREVALNLPAADAGIFIEASAITNWHRTHQHCPLCGTATEIEVAGWVRRCPADNSEHFPRIDPAIIVAVVGPDDRILLGGGSSWETNRYSTLAGFVEPGESLEQAVVREIAEEVGVRLHSPRYLGSQGWPFPASLMLGFTAQTEDTVATPDGVEISRARWFSRAEIQQAVTAGEVVISTRTSIARALIEHWYGGPIQDAAGTPVPAVQPKSAMQREHAEGKASGA
ncbi:NAD(+) diphosphatase [Paenarthrobacter sp. PH39-S1]|uniref:NAD(+) diphosphatase n=1 Tax=Paenarthrobacter sp. PH39-S1 TaxID=3046204 RepID=UPI0024BAE794|nr:NAD(+) diphosphatase [Paenarthrobacter sp. PH39-S1]MDJ0355557.1 NAD(+) diphosphatase [Paenarthrobacter sp. PH39-S1]